MHNWKENSLCLMNQKNKEQTLIWWWRMWTTAQSNDSIGTRRSVEIRPNGNAVHTHACCAK